MTVRFKNVKDIHPTPFGSTWLELVEVLSDHVERKHKLEGSLWSPAVYIEGTTRGNNGVQAMSAFVADLDGESLDGARERLNRYRHCAYTTYSHATGEEHWHVVVPFAHEVGAGSWRSVWQWCHRELGLNGDEVTHDPARLYFLPQHAPQSEWAFVQHEGELLEPPAMLAWQPSRQRQGRSTPRQPRAAWLDEAWWNEPVDISRWEGLTGKALYSAMLTEWQELVSQLEQPSDDRKK
jgi:hypothetical protein